MQTTKSTVFVHKSIPSVNKDKGIMDSDKEPIDAAEAEERFQSLSASRKGRLGACTRKMNEIKVLMETGGNVEKVDDSVALFQKTLDEFKETHVSVQTFLSEEIKENERINWYEPKMSTFENFLQDVEKWKISETDPQSLIEPKDSISNVSIVHKPQLSQNHPLLLPQPVLKLPKRKLHFLPGQQL